MRDEKEERSKQGQTNNKAKQQSTPKVVSCLGWDSKQRQSTLKTEHSTTQLPRQLSWLGPNLTSHSTPDEQANHQLSLKEKAGVMYMYVLYPLDAKYILCITRFAWDTCLYEKHVTCDSCTTCICCSKCKTTFLPV